MCLCVNAYVLHSTQKKSIVAQTRNNRADCFPDREGLVSHSKTGPIYCLWLQKTGNRSHSKRAQLTEQTAEMLLTLLK